MISGGELFDRISEKTVYSEKDARDLIRKLLEVLVYLDDKQIAHRDLKVRVNRACIVLFSRWRASPLVCIFARCGPEGC
jgi:serine/threonine protein kinase